MHLSRKTSEGVPIPCHLVGFTGWSFSNLGTTLQRISLENPSSFCFHRSETKSDSYDLKLGSDENQARRWMGSNHLCDSGCSTSYSVKFPGMLTILIIMSQKNKQVCNFFATKTCWAAHRRIKTASTCSSRQNSF